MSHAAVRFLSPGQLRDSAVDSPALEPAKVGMIAFLATEAAFFGTLLMAYVYFLGQTTGGEPNPRQVFRMPIVLAASACLFLSSGTIALAERSLRRDSRRAFLAWWGLSIVLGLLFLLGTANEWRELIVRWGLTISSTCSGRRISLWSAFTPCT